MTNKLKLRVNELLRYFFLLGIAVGVGENSFPENSSMTHFTI